MNVLAPHRSMEETLAMRRADLLSVLAARFPDVLSFNVRQTIENMTNPATLQVWMIAAIRVDTGSEYLEAMED